MSKKDDAQAGVDDEIIVKDPQDIRPVSLPLVVTLPESASKAQVAYTKILNAYAYKNPVKWLTKKEALIAHLKDLKTAPDPIENPNLQIGQKNMLGS
jgi:hypothetical protein